MRFKILIFVFALVLGGCKKDPPVPSNPFDTECSSLAWCDNDALFQVMYYDSTQFHSPCINPINPTEFIYLYTNSKKPTLNGLYKYSLITKIRQKISSLGIQPNFKWGKNGWIIFCFRNSNSIEIHKIKSNGDSLTRLSTGYTDLYPDWDSKGNHIIFNRQPYGGSPNSKIMIADINGNLLDSIESKFFYFGSCNDNSEICIPSSKVISCGVSIINLTSKDESILYSPEKCTESNQGFAWHPDLNSIYCSTYFGGIYKIDKSTKEITTIKSPCLSKTYSNLSVSGLGDFILCEKTTLRVQNCYPWYKSEIYKISIDGKTETKISLE